MSLARRRGDAVKATSSTRAAERRVEIGASVEGDLLVDLVLCQAEDTRSIAQRARDVMRNMEFNIMKEQIVLAIIILVLLGIDGAYQNDSRSTRRLRCLQVASHTYWLKMVGLSPKTDRNWNTYRASHTRHTTTRASPQNNCRCVRRLMSALAMIGVTMSTTPRNVECHRTHFSISRIARIGPSIWLN